ncbi:MAG: hypothetical protein A3H98_03315 [Bacteroidetes bacterium RIFCSPLOWO2_02_FULL_36_8]|nr:MAG: hypothetical protein A3H98_03315 [Bacteroidetes bacterium RIFCSPLOWO2_02_FULL_36_8]OFY71859.1 MAG: hypothetical protein A3G23_04860 [Bacteroidetes bacterium RIFCSPLOWO2_12_FULL_37_12]
MKTTKSIFITAVIILLQFLPSCKSTEDITTSCFNTDGKYSKRYYRKLEKMKKFSRNEEFAKNKLIEGGKFFQEKTIVIENKELSNSSIFSKQEIADSKIFEPSEETEIIHEDVFASNVKAIKAMSKKELKTALKTVLSSQLLPTVLKKTKIETPPFPKDIQQPKLEISEGLAVTMAITAFALTFVGLIFGLMGSTGLMFISGLLAMPLALYSLIKYPDNGYVLGFASAALTMGFLFTLSYLSEKKILTQGGAQGIFYIALIGFLLWAFWLKDLF